MTECISVCEMGERAQWRLHQHGALTLRKKLFVSLFSDLKNQVFSSESSKSTNPRSAGVVSDV